VDWVYVIGRSTTFMPGRTSRNRTRLLVAVAKRCSPPIPAWGPDDYSKVGGRAEHRSSQSLISPVGNQSQTTAVELHRALTASLLAPVDGQDLQYPIRKVLANGVVARAALHSSPAPGILWRKRMGSGKKVRDAGRRGRTGRALATMGIAYTDRAAASNLWQFSSRKK